MEPTPELREPTRPEIIEATSETVRNDPAVVTPPLPEKKSPETGLTKEAQDYIGELRLPLEKEEGRRVQEALESVFAGGKITPEQMRSLFSEGIVFAPEDKILPVSHRRGDSQYYICEALPQKNQIVVYPLFAKEANAKHIIAHEIGELIQRKKVMTEDESDTEWVVDRERYKAIVTARYQEDGKRGPHYYANGDYIKDQAGGDHYLSEMLADDIADFLTSPNARTMLYKRMKRIKDYETDVQIQAIRSDATHPIRLETEQVFNFLQAELGRKLPKVTEESSHFVFDDELMPTHSIANNTFSSHGPQEDIAKKVIDFFWQTPD